MALLEVENIHSYYGHIQALRGVSLTVEEGEVVTLIGSNGAGKTTTLRSIHGILPPREGRIVFRGEEIQGKPAHDMIKRGIAQSPEGRKIFHRMTVLENLEMGAFHRNDRAEIEEDMTRVFDLFPRLKERVRQEAGTMSGGEQQMLAIGRSLMGRPKLLLLDEPSMGLAPVLVERIFQVIGEINKQGTTILLVEQNANVALEIATRGYVLETGSIVNTASAEKLREDPKVREAYLARSSLPRSVDAEMQPGSWPMPQFMCHCIGSK
jgi:branched-chain amino acid transport system ATP-binding protein